MNDSKPQSAPDSPHEEQDTDSLVQDTSLLAQIANQTINGILVTDIDGSITWTNAGFERVTGYALDEIIGKHPGQLLQGPDSDPDTVRYMRESLAAQQSFVCEIINYRKDKTPIWLDIRCDPLMDEDGVVTGFLALEMDVTEKKQADLRAIEQEKLLTAICEQARVGGWELDLRTNQVTWSDLTREIHDAPIGYQPDLDTAINFYKAGEHRDRIQAALAASLAGQGHWSEELQIVTLQGREKWVSAKGHVEFLNGEPVKLFGTFQDIEAQKRTEAQLEAARDAAEAATQAKSDFLATMSHEIRTPMNGVVGMLELLSRTNLTDEQRRFLQTSQASANSLLKVINDILDFSRVQSGKLAIEHIEFDLIDTFSEHAEATALQAEQAGLQLVLDLHQLPEQTRYRGDPYRLRQIIENLVSNAIKFTNEGEITITARIEQVRDEQVKLLCKVRDTGIGIPDEMQSVLFDAFTQVDASTNRKFGGSGLGLAIAKQLCELMNGTLSVTSKEGEGSTFCFEILLEALDAYPASDVPGNQISRQQRVMLIEPYPGSQLAICNQLQAWGIEVLPTSNLQQANEAISQETDSALQIDVVLMDIELARSAGDTGFRALFANPAILGSQLILVTGTGFRPKEKGAWFSAEKGSLSRPVTPVALKRFMETDAKSEDLSSTANHPDIAPRSESRILLVEDNEVNQFLVQELLIDLGLDCEIANNGVEALNRLKADDSSWDLILMDCQMPVMDGYTTSEQIRAGKAGRKNKHVPIVALTANAMKGDREKCLAAGMNGYLGKPIDAGLLEKVLMQMLD